MSSFPNTAASKIIGSSAGVHIIPSNSIPNIDWLILGAEINHVVVVNNWTYDGRMYIAFGVLKDVNINNQYKR